MVSVVTGLHLWASAVGKLVLRPTWTRFLGSDEFQLAGVHVWRIAWKVKHQSGRPTDISSGPVTSTAMPVTLLLLSLYVVVDD